MGVGGRTYYKLKFFHNMTYTKFILSGSVNGQPILLNTSNSLNATPIHTSITSSSAFDEIYLYATNNNTFGITVTVCWGGTGSLNQLPINIPSSVGRVCICDGVLLNNGLTALVYATVTGSILIDGFVNRIQ